jgi:predicted N-formylglutamate amidohydrolase
VSAGFEELRGTGASSRLILVCEHASNAIPPEYSDLGLPSADRERHIAWDIGAAGLTRALSERLDATAFLGTVSRLVIDINRHPWHPGFVPESSDGSFIPGNAGVGSAERARRAARWFTPFHDRVAAEVDARVTAGAGPILIGMHSFTPVFGGVSREWHVGVLHARERALAGAVLDELTPLVPGPVGDNRPYRIEYDGTDYSIPVHGDDRAVPAIAFEVRHDQIDDESGVEAWCDRLATALERAVAR